MQDALRIITLLALLNLGLVAYFLTLAALFPRRAAKTRAVADLMPGRSFAVGLVNFLFFGAITFALFTLSNNIGSGVVKAIIALPALFFLAVLGAGLSFGLTGMVQLVGERLAPTQTSFRRTLWGALALSLGASLPFVGWFLLLPYAGLLGLGAFIVAFFWKEQSAEAAQPDGKQKDDETK